MRAKKHPNEKQTQERALLLAFPAPLGFWACCPTGDRAHHREGLWSGRVAKGEAGIVLVTY